MKDKRNDNGYTISNDWKFMYEEFGMTPALESQMDEIREIAETGEEFGQEKLEKLIKKYPRNPELKNILIAYLYDWTDGKKAKNLAQQLIEEHPDYFFGKINKAYEYYHQNEFEEIRSLLGEDFHLKKLYPEREVFHISEVLAMNKMALHYYEAIGDFEEAQTRLEIMELIDSESKDYQSAELFLNQQLEIANAPYWNYFGLTVEVPPTPKTDKTETPVFHHPEILWLYHNDFTLSQEEIATILELPRETLIQDLELVLQDSIDRYTYFETMFSNNDGDEGLHIVLHALYFLAEIEATESLPKVLNILRQGEDFVEMFISDFLTEDVWEVLFILGKNQLDTLGEFMLQPGIYMFCKAAVSDAVEQVAHHYPKRKNEVVTWYESFFKQILTITPEANIIDFETTTLVVGNVINLNAKRLLPLVEQLNENGYIFHGISGDFDDIKNSMLQKQDYSRKRKFVGLMDRYKQIVDFMARHDSDVEESQIPFYDDDFQYTSRNQPLVKGKKIGRNDPCPCGSGKKHKKCCL